MMAVMAAGLWTLWTDKIPLEVFQDTPSRFISVNVPYPASSPEETEETIVIKIEEAIQQVGGIKHVNSTAGSGGGNSRSSASKHTSTATVPQRSHPRARRRRAGHPAPMSAGGADHGCTTVIVSGTARPTPRSCGRYMSSTIGGGTV